jgi:hypothetical protein
MSMIRKYFLSVIAIIALLLLLVLPGCSSSDYSVTLTWDDPTTNTDGTTLTDLTGYIISYGKISSPNNDGERKYFDEQLIDRQKEHFSCKDSCNNKECSKKTTKCSYTVTGLQQGDYSFRVFAYNSHGKKSASSTEAIKTAVLREDK